MRIFKMIPIVTDVIKPFGHVTPVY